MHLHYLFCFICCYRTTISLNAVKHYHSSKCGTDDYDDIQRKEDICNAEYTKSFCGNHLECSKRQLLTQNHEISLSAKSDTQIKSVSLLRHPNFDVQGFKAQISWDLVFRALRSKMFPTFYHQSDMVLEAVYSENRVLNLLEQTINKAVRLKNLTFIEETFNIYKSLLSTHKHSPRVLIQTADCMMLLGYVSKSYLIITKAINLFNNVMLLRNISDFYPKVAIERCIGFAVITGLIEDAIDVQEKLVSRFPDDVSLLHKLLGLYRVNEDHSNVITFFQRYHDIESRDAVALVNVGNMICNEASFLGRQHSQYISDLEYGTSLIIKGITKNPMLMNGYFANFLGFFLTLLRRFLEADLIIEEATKRRSLLTFFQRARSYVDTLSSRPIWTIEHTGIAHHLTQIKEKWKYIREEALHIDERQLFTVNPADYNVINTGEMKIYNLYYAGKVQRDSCLNAPITCDLFKNIKQIANNTHGRVYFSLMKAGTHILPHSAISNYRIRAHLGLDIPNTKFRNFAANSLSRLRVANEYLSWENGNILIFDDSFDHEVWHFDLQNRSRLLLIIDIVHPEL